MKIIIVGKTGTGKSSLADAIHRIGGLRIMKSTTTRAPRNDEDRERYNFISKEDAANIETKYIRTTIGEDEYFVTEEELRAADVAILDPYGVRDITSALPDEVIHVVYLHVDPGDGESVTRFENALEQRIKSSDNPEEVRHSLRNKRQSEGERFRDFECMVFDSARPENQPNAEPQRKIFIDPQYNGRIVGLNDYQNDFVPESMTATALNLVIMMRKFKNLLTIVDQCAQLEILSSPEPGLILANDDITGQEVLKPIEDVTYTLLQNPALMTQVLSAWLTHDLNIGLPTELLPQLAGVIPNPEE